ncbi:hypothetical protein U9M48_012493 [Paspalum notatum var. saurae]|uniref:FBD domain-containing protein n=1 Tax=Paspalum notatum var. saurae TaxID=547442 RepID=A0AAQ3SY16_PASNO
MTAAVSAAAVRVPLRAHPLRRHHQLVQIPQTDGSVADFPRLKQLYPTGSSCRRTPFTACSLVALLRINSPTIRSIGFRVRCSHDIVENPTLLQGIVIENATSLQRLLHYDREIGLVTICVIQAPILKILGILSPNISKLVLGTTVFQGMSAISLTTSKHTVKVLVLQSLGFNLDSVVAFLKCFPCVEKLYITIMKNARSYNPLDPIACLDLHLKKGVIINYCGWWSYDVDFATFFVLNAKVLRELIFITSDNCDERDCQMLGPREKACSSPERSRGRGRRHIWPPRPHGAGCTSSRALSFTFNFKHIIMHALVYSAPEVEYAILQSVVMANGCRGLATGHRTLGTGGRTVASGRRIPATGCQRVAPATTPSSGAGFSSTATAIDQGRHPPDSGRTTDRRPQ